MSDTREANYKGVFDNRIGFGECPAVVVIDFIKAYTTPGAAFFGQGVVDAVKASVPLLAAAREASVPIIYTKVYFHPSGADGGMFIKKVPAPQARRRRAIGGNRSADHTAARGHSYRQELPELLLRHPADRRLRPHHPRLWRPQPVCLRGEPVQLPGHGVARGHHRRADLRPHPDQ